MSDNSVRQALRSDGRLVVVEAPAGCGKTHQGAEYAQEIARTNHERVLVLTHTHAACSVFAERTKAADSRVAIRTIDSLIGEVATAYHAGIGIPADPMVWVRQNQDGYAQLGGKISQLLQRYPMIADAIARRYPTIICDEHQDSSVNQHSIAMSLYRSGARLRVFADPVQSVFNDASPHSWQELLETADRVETLDHPHRWSDGSPELGKWILKARSSLKTGGRIDLRTRPPSVKVLKAENVAQKQLAYQLKGHDSNPIYSFVEHPKSLLVLTRYNQTAASLRAFFGRRILLWEGHTRSALDKFVQQIETAASPDDLGAAIVSFMGEVAIGFSPSQFGDRLREEIADGCSKRRTGKPAMLQELARLIIESPDHRGAARMLTRLHEFTKSEQQFAGVKFDCQREFWDAIRIGQFETPAAGLADLAHRRAYARSQPPARAISTIHKAKGLECRTVVVMPCDGRSFPDKFEARCLLYVALSRAKEELMLVLSKDDPSPLFLE